MNRTLTAVGEPPDTDEKHRPFLLASRRAPGAIFAQSFSMLTDLLMAAT